MNGKNKPLHLTFHSKINSKWMTGVYIKCKTKKFRKERSLQPRLSKEFLDLKPKAHCIEGEKMINWASSKLKSLTLWNTFLREQKYNF